ncbi:MAG: 16S rRNA (guanine(527)-N(7))-methyltransferase RsmG [Desulfobacteraceae bacterium 4572_88]|nr:MAG: 16S rRNA (guanine(527)-N(7))-methyltransferase RsmG [Desulfobacteraceae bacterium 4572_88]
MKIASPEWQQLLADAAAKIAVHTDPEKTAAFAVHAAELLKWNKKVNLTAIKDPAEVAIKHFADSLAPAPMIPPGTSLLDIGSGGGFPGIPLKVLMPSVSVTLIDASRKKVSFQQHVIRCLGLGDIRARHIRAEDLARSSEGANAFDVIVCRALSSLDKFAEMALPLLAEGGVMLALKGRIFEAETEAIHAVPGMSQNGEDRFSLEVRKYRLPLLGSERAIVRIQPHFSNI